MNELDTLVTKDQNLGFLLGNDEDMTFYDIKAANLAYDCDCKYSYTTIHRYPIFSKRYSLTYKVYTAYHATMRSSMACAPVRLIISLYRRTSHAPSLTCIEELCQW